MRFKCANDGFIFDWEPRSTSEIGPKCPNCSSNACDPQDQKFIPRQEYGS